MTLTTVTNNLSITIPKPVRDNIGLAPYDCVSFQADDKSFYVNKAACSQPSNAQRINEAPASYDAQLGVNQVSSAAEITLPRIVVDELQIEPGSVVGLFRDTIGYRFVHIYAPTPGGLIEGVFGQGSASGSPDPWENVNMEYSVQVTREARREIYYGWEQSNRTGDDEPFSNVNEPVGDAPILDSLPISTATNRR